MPESFVEIDLTKLSSVESYDLLASVVVPRPIAFVSTLAASGTANLAPFSFFMVGGSNPPSLMYSPTLNVRGEEKDSLRNVRETGEFVINLVHRKMAEGMNITSFSYGPDESEWEMGSFSPLNSSIVKPARVAEALVQLECRLFQIVEHGSGPNASRYVIGEVLIAHLHESIAEKPATVTLISRIGGRNYLDMADGSVFEMDRPRKPVSD